MYSALIKHACLQHKGCDRLGSYSVQYHSYLSHSSYYVNGAIGFVYGASFSVVKKASTASGKKGAEHDVCESSEPKTDVKSDNTESKYDSPAAGSINSAIASNWKFIAAGRPQN